MCVGYFEGVDQMGPKRNTELRGRTSLEGVETFFFMKKTKLARPCG